MAPQPPAPPPLASKDVSSQVFSLFSTTFQAPKSVSTKTPSQARAAKANEESDFTKFGRSNDGIGHVPGKKEVEDQSTADLRKRVLGRGGGKKVVVGDWNRKEKERAAGDSSDEEEGRSGLGKGKKNKNKRKVRQDDEENEEVVESGGDVVALESDAVSAVAAASSEDLGKGKDGETSQSATQKVEAMPSASGEGKKKKKKKSKKRKIEEAEES